MKWHKWKIINFMKMGNVLTVSFFFTYTRCSMNFKLQQTKLDCVSRTGKNGYHKIDKTASNKWLVSWHANTYTSRLRHTHKHTSFCYGISFIVHIRFILPIAGFQLVLLRVFNVFVDKFPCVAQSMAPSSGIFAIRFVYFSKFSFHFTEIFWLKTHS